MQTETNVAEVERWASALSGAALAVLGIRQGVKDRSIGGVMLAAAGTTLIYRGATGHCPVYAAAGINRSDDTRVALAGARGVLVDEAVTINRPAEELYAFWRNFEQLPRFMRNLVSVRQIDACQSHWVASAPGGLTVSWDAEVINEIPGELIAWRTIHGSTVVSAGSVNFHSSVRRRGTVVRVRMQYNPPAGKLGHAVAALFGQDASHTIREDLRRFKQLMEAGEIPTTAGQPRGRSRILSIRQKREAA
jgi:uncharacterized membrane protein